VPVLLILKLHILGVAEKYKVVLTPKKARSFPVIRKTFSRRKKIEATDQSRPVLIDLASMSGAS